MEDTPLKDDRTIADVLLDVGYQVPSGKATAPSAQEKTSALRRYLHEAEQKRIEADRIRRERSRRKLGERKAHRLGKIQRAMPQIIAMLYQGMSVDQISEATGLIQSSIEGALYIARQRGQVMPVLDDRRMKHIAVPLAIDSLIHHLRNKDKDITVETLKGVGRFQTHSQVKTDAPAAQVSLNVAFEVPSLPAQNHPVIDVKPLGAPNAALPPSPIEILNDDSTDSGPS